MKTGRTARRQAEARGSFRILSACLRLLTTAALATACVKSYGDFSNVPDRQNCIVDLALPNMACREACPINVRDALAEVDGVQSVEVDYEARRATVEAVYPACSNEGFEQMMKNLYAKGYRARISASRRGDTNHLP